MKIIRLDPKVHYAIITPWYEARGDKLPDAYIRPDDCAFGVEDEKGNLLACGFLLRTHTKTAFGEFYMTDPSTSTIRQARALRFLAVKMQFIARALGHTVLIGLVDEDHTSLRDFYVRQNAYESRKRFKLFYKDVTKCE